MAKTKSRFVCPKHGCQCQVVFNRAGGGRFHSCGTCYAAGDKFTVEGHEPFKAYGNVAEEFGQLGVSQAIQVFPTALEERRTTLQQDYISFLHSITPEEESDYRVLKRSIEEFVHPLGGKYKKMTKSDVDFDLMTLRRTGTLTDGK